MVILYEYKYILSYMVIYNLFVFLLNAAIPSCTLLPLLQACWLLLILTNKNNTANLIMTLSHFL